MKTWIALFSVALFAGGTCLGVALHPRLSPKAPGLSDGRRPGEMSVHRFASELDLSEEQDAALDGILGEAHQEIQALGRAQRAAYERSRERLLGLLTPEQREKLDRLIAEERDKRAEAELSRKIAVYRKFAGLDEAQARTLHDLLRGQRDRRRSFFRERRHGGDFQASRAFLKTLKEETNAAIAEALTPDQFAKYLELAGLDD